MIRIIEVLTKRQLSEFIKFPDKLYKGNKYRVPQLHFSERSILSPAKNPAFDFCEAKYWLAYENNKIVGRIAGIINNKSNEIWNEMTVRFGWIDFIENTEVSSALIKTVEEWGKLKGMTKIIGPMGFTDMDLEGMLVEGFEEISTQTVIYNYPYYPVHIEKLGFAKDVDWIQYEIKVPDEIPDKVKRISELVKQKYNLKILNFKKAKDILPYAHQMFLVYNEALRHLYGFVPLTERQIKYYIDQYFSMINPKYIKFVIDNNNDVVGFGLCFLSLSKAFMKAKGKLFPFGFIHILRAMKKNDTSDLLIQAVKDEYKTKGIPALFYADMMQTFIDNDVKIAISSSVLEENKRSFLMFTNGYEARQHMVRRSYSKAI
ncbi:MAG: N-acetyltransferase [Bacteroidales bacterium]|jgi:hypothetical protein